MKFIGLLIALNFLIFTPRYFFKLPLRWNPFRFITNKETLASKLKSIYFSRTIDPFRFSLEYSLIVLFWFLFSLDQNAGIYVFAIVSTSLFLFNLYVGVFLELLKKTPIVKSDWFFLRESISIYKGYFGLIIIATLLLILLVFSCFYYLNSILYSLNFRLGSGLVFLLFILVNGFYKIRCYNITDYCSRVVFSLIVFIQKSSKQTKAFQKLYNIPKEEVKKLNHFTNIRLKKRPNIHVISMESYGSILMRDNQNYSDSQILLNAWSSKFRESNIKCVSSFSKPPLFATGTWYSYSTLLFGMLIENGTKQNVLFSEMVNFEEYESLFQFTKREGYTNFLVQGMIGEFDSTLDFNKLKKNLNYDHIIYDKKLEYSGQLLKFMNLQNCVPDQYTLNKGLDIAQESKNPYTLLFCTLNAHWDFYSPTQIKDDWKSLNETHSKWETTMNQGWNRQKRYSSAINYTINAVFDTIHKRMSDNDIFIVYGDHQPTMLTDEKYGSETPFHIFSNNEMFLNEWKQYGFNNGLYPEENKSPIKFEAFYSAFMKAINKCYGQHPDLDIPFFKDGISLFSE